MGGITVASVTSLRTPCVPATRRSTLKSRLVSTEARVQKSRQRVVGCRVLERRWCCESITARRESLGYIEEQA